MPQKSPNEYYDEDMARAKSRNTKQKVMVCEVCGDISQKDEDGPPDKWCSHTTSYFDGSYGYGIPRVPYHLTLKRA